MAGFYRILSPSYRVEVFTDPYEALVWLGAADQQNVIVEVDRLVDGLCEVSFNVRAIRDHIRGSLSQPASLRKVAACLGLSPRSLQRRLGEANSSYRAELAMARMDTAKHLLLDADHSIKQVALDVGCSSASAFDFLFRKFEGQSPTAWRSRVSSGCLSATSRDSQQ